MLNVATILNIQDTEEVREKKEGLKFDLEKVEADKEKIEADIRQVKSKINKISDEILPENKSELKSLNSQLNSVKDDLDKAIMNGQATDQLHRKKEDVERKIYEIERANVLNKKQRFEFKNQLIDLRHDLLVKETEAAKIHKNMKDLDFKIVEEEFNRYKSERDQVAANWRGLLDSKRFSVDEKAKKKARLKEESEINE